MDVKFVIYSMRFLYQFPIKILRAESAIPNSIMIRVLVFISLAGLSLSTPAASFDCAKATTRIEKLICNSSTLSDLDTALGQTFNDKKENLSPEEGKRLDVEQLRWLKNTRSRCETESCIAKVYKDRIDELDPFADKQLTCEKMRKYKNQIFPFAIDLGSGSGAPIDVDYSCPESVASLPFMTNLLGLAEMIRGEESRECTGTIMYAHRRGYQFSLTRAGFAPLIFLELQEADQQPEGNFASLYPMALYSNQLKYFRQWSEESPHNYRLYHEFFNEFDKVLPKLSAHYSSKFGLSIYKANEVAKHALMLVVSRAAGTFSEEILKPESALVQLVRDSRSSPEKLRLAVADVEMNSVLSKEDVYQALVVALLQNRPIKYVSLLMDRLSPSDIAQYEIGKEPLLSFATQNQQNLIYLLSKNVPIDAENNFGKTALFYAIGLNEHESVEILLQNKTDVNHAYKSLVQLRPSGYECEYPNLGHARRTPLMHAAQNSDVRMLKLLLKNGARLDAVDDLGFNALDYAVMGRNKDNQAFLKTLGLELGAPSYSSNADSSVKTLEPLATVLIDGYVSKLAIAPGRPDILVAAIQPWDKLIPDTAHGLYLISIKDPDHPSIISHLPGIRIQDFSVSPDGNTAYVLDMRTRETKDGDFGVLMVDIADPSHPKLIERISGDFMTIYLSQDGKHLYVQERKLLKEFSRGLMVYSVGRASAKLLCNPFVNSPRFPSPEIFAYSFAELPEEHLLIIHDQLSRVYLYDVNEPCNPTLVLDTLSGELGVAMVGSEKRTVISGGNGIYKFNLADPLVKVASYFWSGVVENLAVDDTKKLVAATFEKEVAIFKIKTDGRFSLKEKYVTDPDYAGGLVFSKDGKLYVGAHGRISVVRVIAQ